MIHEKFVVLEGIDGSGTSTQLDKLSNYCKKHEIKSHFTYEPTNSPIGAIIRSYLKGEKIITNSTLPYLLLADRNEHLQNEQGILYHLNQNSYVFCDRYIFSTLAYQSLDFSIKSLYEQNKQFLLPHKVIFIDTPVSIADARIESRNKDREIYEEVKLQQLIRENYLKAFDFFKDEIELLTINGEKSIQAIFDEIINFLEFK